VTPEQVQPKPSDPPKLYVRMIGPKVGEAKLAASDLADIVARTQQALKRVGQVLYGQESLGKGRKKKDIEELCQLFVVGWEKGSAIAALELAPPPAQLHLFGYIGERSLEAFLKGMALVSDGAQELSALPPGFDLGVLETCDALGRALEHGIDEMTFTSPNGVASQGIVYDRRARESVRRYLARPAELGRSTRVGRIEVLSGHGGITGRLWEPDGTRWNCHFREEHLDVLPDTWMRTVQVTGRAIVEEGKERVLDVDSIVIVSEEREPGYGATEAADFWKSVSLEELIEQQGVVAADDLDAIGALWPADDDPDDLLRFLLAERGEQRKIAAATGGDE